MRAREAWLTTPRAYSGPSPTAPACLCSGYSSCSFCASVPSRLAVGAGELTDGDIICGYTVVLVRRRGRRECRERRVVRCRAHDEHVEALYLPVVENDANVRWWRRVHLYSCQEWYGVTSHRWAVASRRGPRALCDAPVAQPRWRQAVQTPWTLYAFRSLKSL